MGVSPTVQVTFDCTDPHRTADFWAAALGYAVPDGTALVQSMLDAGHASAEDTLEYDGRLVWRDAAAAEDPDGSRPRLFFQRVPEPKSVKNRLHLDVHVGPERVADEVARLEQLGAHKLYDGQLGPQTWVTMADPEGNEFCVE
jgi:hypothetical protein